MKNNAEGFSREIGAKHILGIEGVAKFVTEKATKLSVVSIKFSSKDDTAMLSPLKGWSEISCRK